MKYLGYTSSKYLNSYYGSGSYWKSHLKVHGQNISTEYIAAFDSIDDVAVAGKFWSNYWNVVDSPKWANLCEELGHGGWQHFSRKGIPHSLEAKQKMRQSHLGKTISPATKLRISLGHKGKKRIPFSESHKQKLSKQSKMVAKTRQRNNLGRFI